MLPLSHTALGTQSTSVHPAPTAEGPPPTLFPMSTGNSGNRLKRWGKFRKLDRALNPNSLDGHTAATLMSVFPEVLDYNQYKRPDIKALGSELAPCPPNQTKQKHEQKDKQALLYNILLFCLLFDIVYFGVVYIQSTHHTTPHTYTYTTHTIHTQTHTHTTHTYAQTHTLLWMEEIMQYFWVWFISFSKTSSYACFPDIFFFFYLDS